MHKNGSGDATLVLQIPVSRGVCIFAKVTQTNYFPPYPSVPFFLLNPFFTPPPKFQQSRTFVEPAVELYV